MPKHWTAKDDATLRRLYPKFPVAEVARRMDRTPNSVRTRAKKIGATVTGAHPMKNTMVDVRNHLIAQLERLGDASPEELAQEIDRAKALGQLGTVLIESAKAEVQFLTAIEGAVPSGFLPSREQSAQPPQITDRRRIA